MSNKNTRAPEATDRELANSSGIPLQRHLCELVRRAFGAQGAWMVEAEEVPAKGGFLDMLLKGHDGMTQTQMRAAVEVKRWTVAHRPMRLLFLSTANPRSSPDPFSHLPYFGPMLTFTSEVGGHDLLASGGFQLAPETPTAQHCIFEERKGSDGMDSVARELLGQVEALSNARVFRQQECAILPMIVTNAELRVLQLGEVDLDSGALVGGDDDGTLVPYLRYQKTLAEWGHGHEYVDEVDSFDQWSKARMRTVFVVQAKHFVPFLHKVRISAPWNKSPR